MGYNIDAHCNGYLNSMQCPVEHLPRALFASTFDVWIVLYEYLIEDMSTLL